MIITYCSIMTFKLTNFPPKKIMNTVTCLVARAVESYCPLCNTMSLLQHNFQFSKCIIQVIWIIFQFLGTCKAKIAFTYGNVVNDPFDQAVGFEIDWFWKRLFIQHLFVTDIMVIGTIVPFCHIFRLYKCKKWICKFNNLPHRWLFSVLGKATAEGKVC